MKRIKRIASLVLAMAMVFAMSVTVFAGNDPSNNPTTNGSENTGDEITIKSGDYEIFQVFTGDFSGGKLSNIKWGSSVNTEKGTEGNRVPEEILKELSALDVPTTDEQTRLSTITKYVDLEKPLNVEPSENNATVVYRGLTPGYYLVKGTVSFNNTTATADTLYVVEVIDGVLRFTPKVDVPTVDKKIVEDNGPVDANEASIGDIVTYEITGTLPSRYSDYKKYTYEFTDVLSKGLTPNNDIKVFVKNGESEVDITSAFTGTSVEYKENTDTTIVLRCEDLTQVAGVSQSSKIVVKYTATLNKYAVINGTGNLNSVYLKYSSNPNYQGSGTPGQPDPNEPMGTTPTKDVKTFTTQIKINKVDQDGKVLQGAGFTLDGTSLNLVLIKGQRFVEDANGAYYKLKDGTYTETAPTTGDNDNSYLYEMKNDTEYQRFRLETYVEDNTESAGEAKKVEAVVNSDGVVTFTGLGAGVYTISETITPPGYNTIDPIVFEIKARVDETTKDINGLKIVKQGTDEPLRDEKDTGTPKKEIFVMEDNFFTTTIKNVSGSLLPSTGGIGTTIFYVVGGLLVAGAGILLVTKKRMSAR